MRRPRQCRRQGSRNRSHLPSAGVPPSPRPCSCCLDRFQDRCAPCCPRRKAAPRGGRGGLRAQLLRRGDPGSAGKGIKNGRRETGQKGENRYPPKQRDFVCIWPPKDGKSPENGVIFGVCVYSKVNIAICYVVCFVLHGDFFTSESVRTG